MIIQCPNCATKYKLPDDKFKEGAKVKCKACQHVFKLGEEPAPVSTYSSVFSDEPDTPEEHPLEQKRVEDLLAGLNSEFDPMVDSKPSESPGPEEDETPGEDFADHEESVDAEADPGDKDSYYNLRQSLNLDLGSSSGQKKGKRTRRPLSVILFLLVLLGVAYFGVNIFAPQLMPEALRLPREETAMAPEEPEAQAPAIPVNQVKNIALVNVKQYFAKNEKVGKVFVIEGGVANNFETPKEMIKIEATLFDAAGTPLDSKRQFCGNTVSLFQLQVLTQDELEANLQNEIGILSKNTFVQPGGEVPFMVLFYNTPDTVSEFAVNVIEARDPPEDK